ncbi:tetratricopeptide repeat protein [Paracoccus sp. JM45]|uniref:tetratricopeptide repeat protein n=1 Tax=Paracoccus sp. JM45 TaxID=2283626 RepID=UPI000E6D0E86|nr:tetratricopeptide repeat protein [Paracoccus sp. JM45]RJE80639.1 tol-pal system protein [Paracoccus sp. JM45]
MIRRAVAAGLLTLSLAGGAGAQAAPDAATLADMRGQLSQLRGQLQSLRSELVASGASGFQAAGGASAIDRMNAMESHLTRLTNQAERLQNRINTMARETDRQLSDLEFRVCEMDETCDLSALTTLKPQVGSGPDLAPSAPAVSDDSASAATASEQADFDAAVAVMEQGDNARAAGMFEDVAQTHAGGPLTAEALFLRGQSLQSAGQPRDAAAAWLEGFAADPDGPRAAESLLGIATVIEEQGEATAACLYLAEVPARFPGTSQATTAEQRIGQLGCGIDDLGALDPLLDPDIDPEAAADLAEYR